MCGGKLMWLSCILMWGFHPRPDLCYEAKLSYNDCQPDWVCELKSRYRKQTAKLDPDVQIPDTRSAPLGLQKVLVKECTRWRFHSLSAPHTRKTWSDFWGRSVSVWLFFSRLKINHEKNLNVHLLNFVLIFFETVLMSLDTYWYIFSM